MKPTTFPLPSQEIQTNDKYCINYNCTICNACYLFKHSNFCDCFCKIREGTPQSYGAVLDKIKIAWLHPQMSNYFKKSLKILNFTLLNELLIFCGNPLNPYQILV